MGRARISLKKISNDKSRKKTFMDRRKVLVKKTHEFSNMCGVEACLIVYDDDDDDSNGDVEPVTFPQEPTLVHSILQKYELQKNERPPKTFGVQDFVQNRKNMLQDEISKLHKQIGDIKYPSWDPSFANMEEEQLGAFIVQVDAKIRACDHVLKNMVSWGSQIIIPTSSTTTIEPPNNNNGRVDVANSMNQVYEASNHGMNMLGTMQQVEAPFGYIPDMVLQKSVNATSSLPSLPNCLQDIVGAFKPLDVENEKVDFCNQVDVPLETNLMEWFDGPIDWSNLCCD